MVISFRYPFEKPLPPGRHACGQSAGKIQIMNAEPYLYRIAAALAEVGLETVLIGNAAAALQGAPVTTLDFDFMFRLSPRNIAKLKRLATILDGMILKPFYPVSQLYRIIADDESLQLDFMPVIHGIKSFASLRSRAQPVLFGRATILVADLADIIRSKKALKRERDLAVLPVLEKTLSEKQKKQAKNT